MHLRYSLVLLLLTALYGQTAAPTPAFEDYPVAARWRGKPAAVKFDSKGLPDSDPRAREIVDGHERGLRERNCLWRDACARRQRDFRRARLGNPNLRIFIELCHQPPQIAERHRDAARGRPQIFTREMKKYRAATSRHAWSRIVVDLDDEIVEMIVAP